MEEEETGQSVIDKLISLGEQEKKRSHPMQKETQENGVLEVVKDSHF